MNYNPELEGSPVILMLMLRETCGYESQETRARRSLSSRSSGTKQDPGVVVHTFNTSILKLKPGGCVDDERGKWK